MRLFLLILSLALPLAVSPQASAQEAADPTLYVLNYVEVVPAMRESTAKLLREFAEASRKDAGALRFEVLGRTAPTNQFMILEAWKDQQALDAHASAAHTKKFHESIAPMLLAPIDERLCIATAVAPAQSAPGSLYVITHVDVGPPNREKIIVAFNALVGPSRKDAGNLRFDVVQQKARTNHFKMIEVWKDQAADDAHENADHTKAFRAKLLPLTGALYDQRWYKAL
jgi:quinol monooxygenase YgiN